MKIFRQLTEKPWLPAEDPIADIGDAAARPLPAARAAVKMYLVVVGILFMLLTIAFADRMAFEDWYPTPPPRLMWQNTIMLILSSVAMQWALHAAGRGKTNAVTIGLFAGGACAFAFLVAQFLAAQQLVGQDYFEIRHPAIVLFILITGLHGLHLLGGLVAWGWTIDKVWRSGPQVVDARPAIELCTLYWHVLLVVWLVLFGLLFSGNNNLAILLTICGIR